MLTWRLGTTDMSISAVGLGTWAFGGSDWRHGWGPQSDADSIATVHAAVAAGVNWIDTAAVYGLGHSEEVVGAALHGLPAADRPLLFTKCGLVWQRGDRYAAPRRLMRAESVRRELTESLRRLRVDHIDLYQVHQPGDGHLDDWGQHGLEPSPHATALGEYWQTMADLVAEGKVRAIGLSNHTAADLDRAERIAHVDVIQPAMSAIARDAAEEIRWAVANGAGVLAYQPMYSGLLTGAFSAERVAALPVDDWRRSDLDFTDRLAANLAVVDTMRNIAAEHAVPVAAVAVGWVLAWPGVTGAIVGGRRPEQVAGWRPAATLRLTDVDLDRIAAAIIRSGAGSGPVDPRSARPRGSAPWSRR